MKIFLAYTQALSYIGDMKNKYSQMTAKEILSVNPIRAAARVGAVWVIQYTKLSGTRNEVRKTFDSPQDCAFWVRSQEAKFPKHQFNWSFVVELESLKSDPFDCSVFGYIDACNKPMQAEEQYSKNVHRYEDSKDQMNAE